MTFRSATYRGRVAVHTGPLFPGYAFVSLDVEDDPDERWKCVNSTKAVQTLLPASDSPIAVADKEIDGLRDAELAGNFVYPRHIAPGARLRVQGGTLAEQVLECLQHDDHRGVVRALWDCFGRKTVVTLPVDDVRVLREA